MGIKSVIKSWLDIQPAQNGAVVIQEPYSFEANAIKNKLIYRGDPSELNQFFTQSATDEVQKARFWASTPSPGQRIRKIHSGLPAMIVNVLADISMTDMLDVEFESASSSIQEVWKQIAEENDFKELLTDSLQDVLAVGDGAFKIAFDPAVSDVPIIEWVSGENVEYTIVRGRVQEVIFHTPYTGDKKHYRLIETYGKGYITYELQTASGKPADLTMLPETADLVDVSWEGESILAVPMLVYKSPKWQGRGRSIFDLKLDNFDALDETISQWQDTLRQGRIKRYIPDTMLPRDPKNGKPFPPNPFDNNFVALRGDKNENGTGANTIHTDQPQLDYNGFIGTYMNNLDLCLQGLISPSTLGIDTKKLDNAEAQREKEKTTLYTRSKIVSVLQKVIPELVQAAIDMYTAQKGMEPEEVKCSVEFGEYANPSFEAQVEVVGAASGSQIMSIESQVRTLWGDSKDDKWIEEEISRIKQERGIAELEEPSFVPGGFKEAENLDGLRRDDNDSSGDVPRAGAEANEVDEAESAKTRGVGDERGLPVESVASGADQELEKIPKRKPTPNKRNVR